MFQINSYLQYKNTPDGKPRVLTEGKDYNVKTPSGLYFVPNGTFDDGWKQIILFSDEWDLIAKLKDCRPLLTVNIDGIEWTEGEVMTQDEEYFPVDDDERKYFTYFLCDGRHGGFGLNLYYGIEKYSKAELEFYSGLGAGGTIIEDSKKLGSFFDDPAHYSKLLWNCSEEEGWQKVFDLLEIKP